MQDLGNKIKVWWQKVSTKKPVYTKLSLKPQKDWAVIFISTQVAIVICAVIAFYFYTQVDAGKLFQVEQGDFENEVKINNVLLTKTVQDINARDENLLRIKVGNIAPPDPSR